MTPKEQLRQISTLNQRIEQRLKLIEYYMEQAERMGGALSLVGSVTGTKEQSPMERWVDKAIDLARDLEAEVEALRAERRLVGGIVDRIENAKQKQVLELRYFSPQPMTWEEIAEKMGLDVRWVYRLHGEALKSYERVTTPVKAIVSRDMMRL